MQSFGKIVGGSKSMPEDGNPFADTYLIPSSDLEKNSYGFPILVRRISFDTEEQAEKELSGHRYAMNNPHPHICNVLDCHQEPNGDKYFVYLVYPALERSLRDEIKAKALESSPWYLETVLWKRLTQLVSAGAFLERIGIANRNISDESIRVTADGDLKLFDFGCAREGTQETSVIATIQKMKFPSPKMRMAIIQGDISRVEHNIFKSDVYSVGMLMLYMSVFELPNFIESLHNLDINIKNYLKTSKQLSRYSQEWISLLQLMLEVQEERRPLFNKLERELTAPEAYADDQAIPSVAVAATEMLQWSLKCGESYIRVGESSLEPFPCLITLVAPSQTAKMREITWDFLCLVDQSGSMADYVKLVQKTIEVLLSRLGERDRICLVSFSDEARRCFPFLTCSDPNKQTVMKEVNELEWLDSSSLIKGLDLAGCALRQRRSSNSRTALLIFTDGAYQVDDEASQALKNIANEFPVHTLQYGAKTEFSGLFASIDNGSFKCIPTELDIQRILEEMLPSLSSVVASDIRIEIALQSDPTLHFVLQDPPSQTFSLSTLLEGERAYFVFRVKVSSESLSTSKHLDAVRVSLTFKDNQGGNESSVNQQLGIKFVPFNSTSSPRVEEVIAAFLRAKAARSVRDAREKARMGELKKAKELLGNRIAEVEQAEYLQHHQWIEDALRNLRLAEQSLSASNWEESGRFPSEVLAFIEPSSNIR